MLWGPDKELTELWSRQGSRKGGGCKEDGSLQYNRQLTRQSHLPHADCVTHSGAARAACNTCKLAIYTNAEICTCELHDKQLERKMMQGS